MTPELLAYAAFFLTMALSFAIMCLGLNLQWGQTGVFNVGVAGFVAIGAYTSALLTAPAVQDRIGGLELPIFVGWIGALSVAESDRPSTRPMPVTTPAAGASLSYMP